MLAEKVGSDGGKEQGRQGGRGEYDGVIHKIDELTIEREKRIGKS